MPADDRARATAARLRAAGYGRRVIARRLNADNVPTASGKGQWHPASVARLEDPSGWAGYIRSYRRRA